MPRFPALAALVCAAALVVAGCGGGGGHEAKPAITTAKNVKVERSLLGGSADSAGSQTDSYTPTGEILVDSGFRPQANGFGFENYGNDVGPVNLRPQEIEQLFGRQVCLSGTGASCRLIPAAQRWMDNQNKRMAGGHCMGFSVAALRFFGKSLDPRLFGGGPTIAMPIVDNEALQAQIAEDWVYQDLASVKRRVVGGTPSHVLQALGDALDSGSEGYTLAIFMADYSGGHAITPFAIEDRGHGRYAILVYDNNFPGITRAVQVDTNRDTWSYVGGTNPKNLGEVYRGDARTQTLSLYPTSPGEGEQPCPFCDGTAGGEGSSAVGSVLPKAERYTEITLSGSLANHPHLVFHDPAGRETGIVDGALKREIPGVEVVQTFSTRNWEASPEPKFRVPEGKDFAITVDGSDLRRKATAQIDLVGEGLVISVQEIKLAPGQQDELTVPHGYGLQYKTDGTDGASPSLFGGLVYKDAAYTFAVKSEGVKRGSTISLLIDRDDTAFVLDSSGSRGTTGRDGYYAMAINRTTDTDESAWDVGGFTLDGTRGEIMAYDYSRPAKRGRPIKLDVAADAGSVRTVKAPYDPAASS
jgi:hypothetical protein